MTLRSILVPNANKLDLMGPLDAAIAIARPMRAHLDVLRISPPRLLLQENIPTSMQLDVAGIERHMRDAAAETKKAFESWCAANGLEHRPEAHLLGSTFARWSEQEGELESVVARAGRLSDLIVVNKPSVTGLQASRCFDAAVFAAGRPTLLAPSGQVEQPLRHVLIAWNGSLEAMHAVALSLDLLHSAERVSIFSVAADRGPGDVAPELAVALRWHGIKAVSLRAPSAPPSVGEALLQAGREVNASLILMGAFTHSRVRETLLGGVTQHILSHCEIPVIMAH